MNVEWSELNKQLQTQLKRKDSFGAGISTLLDLRTRLMEVILSFQDVLPSADFSAIPFINADGYHSKTIAYSIWHIFRIEDIVANVLINNDEQVFVTGDYKRRINAPIITTGNELIKEQIAKFSAQLDIAQLYSYAADVKKCTDEIFKALDYSDLKRKITADKKTRLSSLGVVSSDSNASWLIDYWCSKDLRGLIRMPLSRHWIMHTEAALRIARKLQPHRAL